MAIRYSKQLRRRTAGPDKILAQHSSEKWLNRRGYKIESNGDVWSNTAHIAKSGSFTGTSLCVSQC